MPEAMKPVADSRSNITRVLIVDDHELLRDGLTELLGNRANLTVCGQAVGEDEAMQLTVETQPDLAIVDVVLQQGDGINLVKRIKSYNDSIRVIVCSMFDEKLYWARCLRAGASGYVHKQAPAASILVAIEKVLAGETYTDPAFSVRQSNFNALSLDCETILATRELEVLQLIGQGKMGSEIAEKMALSQRTIDTYRERIKSKLNLRTSAELNRCAVEWVLMSGN